MSAYYVVKATIDDWDAYRAYAERSPGVLAAFGGRHIARGGRTVTFEGDAIDAGHSRLVLARFPDFDAAEACYRSPAYQAIIGYRADCARLEFHLVDGLDATEP